MAITEKELQKRDAKRNLGAELLDSMRQMKAGCFGKLHKVVILPLVHALSKNERRMILGTLGQAGWRNKAHR